MKTLMLSIKNMINENSILNMRSLVGGFVLLSTLLIIFGADYLRNKYILNDNMQTASVLASQPNYYSDIELIANASIVYDITSGEILFHKNAGKQFPLASITKLMLVSVSNEVLESDTPVLITSRALSREGDSGLLENEIWLSQDLIDFTLIESSNDGAEALAEASEVLLRRKYIDAPKKNATIWRMNQKARELALLQTYFMDASGLDLSESMASAYGSARDVAQLMLYLLRNTPHLISATAKDDALIYSINGYSHEAINTNEALGVIPGLIGGKTGFTDLAGGNLVVAFDVGLGRPVIAVVLGSTQDGRFEDMKKLVDATRKTIGNQ
jgi:serine-type D-Ala-D-Ala carboxypeptidase (penicillin-binding protein 5/6)